jgi:Protein of unknown function (DUF1592)/Protein of unknown function (DUF1588)/Protein of unknown function (DUF1587)/Protein of unknown function (DUF1585)/Protein of unknown function (DUF1595)/Planctomycete cytochrome C
MPDVCAKSIPVFAALAVMTYGAEPRPLPVPAAARSFLDRNCIGCHSGAKAPGNLDLTALPFDLADSDTFRKWVRVHDVVRDGQMPPGDPAAVKASARAAFTRTIAGPMIAQERRRTAEYGRSVLRRLNRYEYESTVRDLLGAPWLQLKDWLPEDGTVDRFNKVGQALDVSHVQMARYMETAEQALRLVLAAADATPTTKRYYARDQKRLLNRMRYSPFNRHPERASIPILGFEAEPDVLAEKVPITVGDSDPARRELEGFATPAGTYIGNEYHFDQFAAPVGGKYRVRFNAFSLWIHTIYGAEGRGDKKIWYRPNREKTEKGRTVEPVTIYALSKAGEKRLLGSFDVGPEPALHDLDVWLLPGEQILPDAARLFRSRPGFIGSPHATAEGMPGVAYRWMEITGPLDNAEMRATRAQLLGNGPDDAVNLLRAFLGRAYRRPAEFSELQRYVDIVNKRLNSHQASFEDAMIAGYTAVLCSPGFLYLEEAPGPLTSFALASRLSYFLWNAPPDAELRKLAAADALRDPAVLRAQTNRLLDETRSKQFADAFLDYWLDLRKLNDTTPDVILYPDYYLDDLLTESALKETQLFFDYLVRKNLPARNIVQSDFTMLNSHLARHYGLPSVDGVGMRLVKLPPKSVRGGLLTQASVLKVTANGTTTSPVLRGVWIMERILGDLLPPPPSGTPAIEPDTRGATTMRQQLDKHRSIASCAACHRKIDPPGFALESFDVLGGHRERYRSTETGDPVEGVGKNGHVFTFKSSQPVDASGELITGEIFHDVIGLKQSLLKDERQIARNMLKQLIAYGTGAPVSFGDRPEMERILTAAARDGYRMRTLIHGIIQSKLFTSK